MEIITEIMNGIKIGDTTSLIKVPNLRIKVMKNKVKFKIKMEKKLYIQHNLFKIETFKTNYGNKMSIGGLE